MENKECEEINGGLKKDMAKRVIIKTLEDKYVHFDYEVNNYTLCGLDTCGDPSLGIGEPSPTERRVNCPTCISIVEYCHSINKNEFTV